MFEPQITELRKYVSDLELKIRRWEKAGINTERLKDNRCRAIHTIAELEQYQRIKGKEIGA